MRARKRKLFGLFPSRETGADRTDGHWLDVHTEGEE